MSKRYLSRYSLAITPSWFGCHRWAVRKDRWEFGNLGVWRQTDLTCVNTAFLRGCGIAVCRAEVRSREATIGNFMSHSSLRCFLFTKREKSRRTPLMEKTRFCTIPFPIQAAWNSRSAQSPFLSLTLLHIDLNQA